ncbi:MAG: hypothetical protein Q8P15_02865 [Nanoarchaeota archaeon]|nr:hypothetical protein [Nanoarchaeota archaeon]
MNSEEMREWLIQRGNEFPRTMDCAYSGVPQQKNICSSNGKPIYAGRCNHCGDYKLRGNENEQ